MASYNYSNADHSKIITRSFPIGQAPGEILEGNERYQRDLSTERQTFSIKGENPHRTNGWPFYCDAAAVHPSDIPAAIKHDRENGLNVEYAKDGRPKFEDSRQRKKYLKTHGLHERNSYN